MNHHLELRYWDNGVRRCDIYPEGSKDVHKEVARLTRFAVPCKLATVHCTHDIIAEYREIKKGTVVTDAHGLADEGQE